MANQSLQTRINSFIRSEKSKRDVLQALIVECVTHATQNGNSFDLLSSLISQLIETKARNCNAIRAYILEQVKGISWQKNKSGNFMYKVVGDVVVSEFTSPWYEGSANTAANSNKEVSLASVQAYFKSLKTRMEKQGVKSEDAEKLEQLIAQSQAILTA